jgi:hypothetical protein
VSSYDELNAWLLDRCIVQRDDLDERAHCLARNVPEY